MQELNFIHNREINATMHESQEEIYTVSQLNDLSKKLLERNVPVVWIKGEISGLKLYKHAYFDLKDDGAKISCVMFASVFQALEFQINNGDQIEIRGKVTIYPVNGSYQINVERVRKCGLGELWDAYHRLILKLKTEGLFNIQYKKNIALCPNAIGVITSKEGSVIKDVITTLKRRIPHIPIIIYPTAVQGAAATMQIAQAIRTANQRNEVSTLIICRGGGSMEDLWCFNEEIIAREVFWSKIPIISAIGHETDTTIIDMVADLRASTPTAAAELVARGRDQWLDLFAKLTANMQKKYFYLVQNKQQYLDLLYARLLKLNPMAQCLQSKHLLNNMKLMLKQALINLHHQHRNKIIELKNSLPLVDLSKVKHKIEILEYKLAQEFCIFFDDKKQYFQSRCDKLNLLNPESILLRGYAIVRDSNGNIVKSIHQTKALDQLEITVADGIITTIIK